MTNVQTTPRRPKSRTRRVINATVIALSVVIIAGAAAGALYISRTHNAPTTASPTDDSSYGIPPYGADQSAVAVDPYHLGGVPAYITDALRGCPGNGTRKNNGDLDIPAQRPCLHGMPVFGLKNGAVKTLITYSDVTLTELSAADKTVNGVQGTYRTYDFSVGDHLVFAAGVREQASNGAWSKWTYIPEFGEASFLDGKTYQLTLALRNPGAAATASPEVTLPASYNFAWSEFLPQMLSN